MLSKPLQVIWKLASWVAALRSCVWLGSRRCIAQTCLVMTSDGGAGRRCKLLLVSLKCSYTVQDVQAAINEHLSDSGKVQVSHFNPHVPRRRGETSWIAELTGDPQDLPGVPPPSLVPAKLRCSRDRLEPKHECLFKKAGEVSAERFNSFCGPSASSSTGVGERDDVISIATEDPIPICLAVSVPPPQDRLLNEMLDRLSGWSAEGLLSEEECRKHSEQLKLLFEDVQSKKAAARASLEDEPLLHRHHAEAHLPHRGESPNCWHVNVKQAADLVKESRQKKWPDSTKFEDCWAKLFHDLRAPRVLLIWPSALKHDLQHLDGEATLIRKLGDVTEARDNVPRQFGDFDIIHVMGRHGQKLQITNNEHLTHGQFCHCFSETTRRQVVVLSCCQAEALAREASCQNSKAIFLAHSRLVSDSTAHSFACDLYTSIVRHSWASRSSLRRALVAANRKHKASVIMVQGSWSRCRKVCLGLLVCIFMMSLVMLQFMCVDPPGHASHCFGWCMLGYRRPDRVCIHSVVNQTTARSHMSICGQKLVDLYASNKPSREHHQGVKQITDECNRRVYVSGHRVPPYAFWSDYRDFYQHVLDRYWNDRYRGSDVPVWGHGRLTLHDSLGHVKADDDEGVACNDTATVYMEVQGQFAVEKLLLGSGLVKELATFPSCSPPDGGTSTLRHYLNLHKVFAMHAGVIPVPLGPLWLSVCLVTSKQRGRLLQKLHSVHFRVVEGSWALMPATMEHEEEISRGQSAASIRLTRSDGASPLLKASGAGSRWL